MIKCNQHRSLLKQSTQKHYWFAVCYWHNWAAIFCLVLLFSACSPQKGGPHVNKYGLNIIESRAVYKHSLTDSCKHMVALSTYLKNYKEQWFYATDSNFTHQILYKNPSSYMRLEAAKNLQKVSEELALKGIGLKIFDAYRPYSVTEKMWAVVPDDRYAANPAKGSGHNRGAAIDLTLYNLQTGEELPMPTPFDNFSEKAHHNYLQLDSTILANRKLLRETMEKHGFVALETEWWHYYLPNASQRFEILNFDFRKMKKMAKK
jgi:D-alanyl-D-alanine dipeptidase